MTLIKAGNVDKEFRQGGRIVTALKDVNLTIREGELVLIAGESGSGKSTLLSLLGAMDRPTRGGVWLMGQDLAAASPGRLARLRLKHVGFVFQDFLLLSHLTARDNVRLPLLFDRTRSPGHMVEELLRRVDMGHRMDHRPNALSRGEMQRVAIARALVNRPKLLLADEPTANLDRRSGRMVWDLIRDFNHNDDLTVVAATHSPPPGVAASRIIHLREGKIDAHETF